MEEGYTMPMPYTETLDDSWFMPVCDILIVYMCAPLRSS